MQQELYKFNVKHNQKYSASILSSLAAITEKYHGHFNETQSETIGGILRDGQLGWISIGPHIQIISLKTGTKIASHTFDQMQWGETVIICVKEIQISNLNCGILAICLQSSKHGGVICIYTIQGSRILRTIEIVDKISCCSFISVSTCKNSDLILFDGCLAVGTEVGKVILIDLALKKCEDILHRRGNTNRLNDDGDCLIALAATCSHKELIQQQQKSQRDGINFGIQLEILDDAGPVSSILSLDQLLTIAVGLSDGRLLLYSLNGGLEAYHLAYPPEPNSPLTQMTFIEPADDPRACVYLWAFHNSNSSTTTTNSNSNNDCAIAVMHSITFENKVPTKYSNKLNSNNNNEEYYVYKNFQTSSCRLTMPTFGTETYPIVCQSIEKSFTDSDEDVLSLCLLAWTSPLVNQTTVCLFDLNQWYKEQMPSYCDWRETPSYLAIFSIDHSTTSGVADVGSVMLPPLDIWMDKNTVTPFCSIQRPEEHFYPSALSFHCVTFTSIDSSRLAWSGIQHQILESLSQSGPNIFLEPHRYFAEMCQASLIPQFCDFSYNTKYSVQFKQEFLLSIALEYDCTVLLRQCAKAWADGSYLGNENRGSTSGGGGGLSLSTLTDWIWERATLIKNFSNQLCIPLFDFSATSIDLRSQKILLHCTRQLKFLSELLTMICKSCQQFIPNEIMDTLISQRNSIRMVLEYQEMLQWMLNIGLLPEQSDNFTNTNTTTNNALPIYPYRQLKNAYLSQRRKFHEINPQLLSGRHGCRILYIDAFIEHDCNPLILRNEWKIRKSDVLYPPSTLQSMLRTLLVPNVSLQTKYMLFVYLFLDLCVMLENEGERFAEIVKKINKFPMAFKLDPTMCKTTKAFWNLDHGFYEAAIDDLISPLSQHSQIQQWQQNILIESLLTQKMYSLALSVIRVPGPPVSPFLEIQTLMENNLVIEAFQLQRQKYNEPLLMEFFKYCHQNRKWNYILDLSLNGNEEKCLGIFLKSTNSNIGENLHFLYLIQRSKYIEAIQFIDELHNQQQQHEHHPYQSRRRMKGMVTATTNNTVDFETPSTILKAYKLTMTPATRQISDIYYSLKDNINTQLNRPDTQPIPLSSNLLQSKLNLMGGVYHRSVLSAEQTTAAYWYNQKKRTCQLSANTIPFLRNPQYVRSQMPLYYPQYQQRKNKMTVTFPSVYQNKKRIFDESIIDIGAGELNSVDYGSQKHQAPVKRRRIGDDSITAGQKQQSTKQPSTELGNDDDDEFETTLSTPMVVSSQNSEEKPNYERVATPQSILKLKSGRNSRCSTYSTDSIRFNLPNSPDFLNDITEPIATSSILEQEEENSMTIDDDENIIRHVENMSGDDEEEEDVNAGGDTYHDHDNNFEDNDDKVDEYLEKSTFQHEGPSPRKRLRSFSKQEEQQQPPKMDISSNETLSTLSRPPLRRSTRSRSKTPDIDDKILTRRSIRSSATTTAAATTLQTTEIDNSEPPSSNSEVTTSPNRKLPGPPLRRKPLSRLVLEANAKKVTENLIVQNEATKKLPPTELIVESPKKTTLFESSLDTTTENLTSSKYSADKVNDSIIMDDDNSSDEDDDELLNQQKDSKKTLFGVDESSVESDHEIFGFEKKAAGVSDFKQPSSSSIERIIPVNLLNTDSPKNSNKEFEMMIENDQAKNDSPVLNTVPKQPERTTTAESSSRSSYRKLSEKMNDQELMLTEKTQSSDSKFNEYKKGNINISSSTPSTTNIVMDVEEYDYSFRKPNKLFENSRIESSESFLKLWNPTESGSLSSTTTLNESSFYKPKNLFSFEEKDSSSDSINNNDDPNGVIGKNDENQTIEKEKCDDSPVVSFTPEEQHQTTENRKITEITNDQSLLSETQPIQKSESPPNEKVNNFSSSSKSIMDEPSIIEDYSLIKPTKLFENSRIESSESFLRLWNAAVAGSGSLSTTLNESSFYKQKKLFSSEENDSSSDSIDDDHREIIKNYDKQLIIEKPVKEDSHNLWLNKEPFKDSENCDTESKQLHQQQEQPVAVNEVINISSSSSSSSSISSSSSKSYENFSDEIEEIEEVEDDDGGEHYDDYGDDDHDHDEDVDDQIAEVYDVDEVDEDVESIDMKSLDDIDEDGDDDEDDDDEEDDENDEDDGDDEESEINADEDDQNIELESDNSEIVENIIQLKENIENNDDDILLPNDQVNNINSTVKEPIEMSTLTDTLSVGSELNQRLMANDSDLNNSLYFTELTVPNAEPIILDHAITLETDRTTNELSTIVVGASATSDNLNIAVCHTTTMSNLTTITETEPAEVDVDVDVDLDVVNVVDVVEIDKTNVDTENVTNQTETDLNLNINILTETMQTDETPIEQMEVVDDNVELKNQSLDVDQSKKIDSECILEEKNASGDHQPAAASTELSPTKQIQSEIELTELNKKNYTILTSNNSNESMNLNVSSDNDSSRIATNLMTTEQSPPIQTRLRSNSTSSNVSKKSINTIKTNLIEKNGEEKSSKRQLRSKSIDSPALTNPPAISTPILRNLRARSVTATPETIDSPKSSLKRVRRGQSEEPISLTSINKNDEILGTPKSNKTSRKSIAANENDDSISVASSGKSNRTPSRNSVKNKINKSGEFNEHDVDDDDSESVVSLRSNRSYIRNRKLKGPLPAITEDDITEHSYKPQPMTDYTSDRRLTRSQIIMMEKIQKSMKDQSGGKSLELNKQEQIVRARQAAAAAAGAGSSSNKQSDAAADNEINVDDDHLSEIASVKSKISVRSTRSTRSNKKTSQVDSKSKGKLDKISEVNDDSDDGNSSIITTRSRTSNKSHRTTSKSKQ